MAKRKIYIAYGSNMNVEQMRRRCPSAKQIGVGILKDYKLTFRGTGVANIEKNMADEIPVIIWSITSGCEKLLDVYEGYPRLYTKIEVEAQTTMLDCFVHWPTNFALDHEVLSRVDFERKSWPTIKGMAYVMTNEFTKESACPRPQYFDILYQAYMEHGFDERILVDAAESAGYKRAI